MTTQQPTQQPEAPESPMSDRVSRLEAIAEETHLRLAENHAEHQALSDKIDTLRVEMHGKVDSLRVEMHDKIDRQGESLRSEINGLRAEVNRLRTDMYRQTFLLFGMIGGLMALFTFLD